MAVEFRLLGPVEVRTDGRLVNAGEPRRRAVLAALLVDAGGVVPSTTLIDRVWGEKPPVHAVRTLGTHVTRIRRVLEQAAGGGEPVAGGGKPVAVVSESGGYRLAVDRDRVDLHRLRRLVNEARDPDGSDEERVELLRQAIALWRGEPLTGVPGDWADRTRERLVRERLDVTAAWAEAELRVGNPAAVLAPLAELADEHPMMEPLTVTLVRALVVAGRPAEALERCRVHRRRLAEEQGIDQGPDLRALYEEILRGELPPWTPSARQPATAGRNGHPSGPSGALAARAGATVGVIEVPGSGGVSAVGVYESTTVPPAGLERPTRRAARWRRRWSRWLFALLGMGMCAVVVVGLGTLDARRGSNRTVNLRMPTASDELSGRALDLQQWQIYQMSRDNGSSWSPGMVRVADGELRVIGTGREPTGKGNAAGGVCWCRPGGYMRRYGVWEVKAKFDAGSGYGPMIGLYPESDKPERDGMVTLVRVDQADRSSMYPEMRGLNGNTIQGPTRVGDFTTWNTYAIEWRPDFFRVSVNGATVFDTREENDPVIIPSAPMYLFAQLVPGPDGPVPAPGADTPDQVAMHVAWVRYYS